MFRTFRWILTISVFAATVPSAVVRAEEPKIDPAKVLGQTKDTGSLPLWTQPGNDARQELGKAARAAESGVFIAGSADTTHGTAWVISKKHRLLVTNAHVADLLHEGKGEMFAIPNGTSQVYKVEKVWYHPGVRRYLKGNRLLSVRSMDPKEGSIDPYSPDLAVLQLSAEGPDLTVEFPLATPEELAKLFGQPAALFGFPGHDTEDWPKLGKKVAATYHDGVISRITDFERGTDGPASELQFVQYTMFTWGGFSGSPVFLPNGRVAAVHNMARTASKGKEENKIVKSIAHGIRADCILEMLVHHGLQEKVPFKIDKSKVAVERWIKPDKRTEKARADWAKAIALADEAGYLVYTKEDYEKGIEKCDEALKLVPNYARAYAIRGGAFGNYRFDFEDRLSKKEQLVLATKAFEDEKKAAQLEPSSLHYMLGVCNALNNLGLVTDDTTFDKESFAIADKMLSSKNLSDRDRASALSRRAVANDHLGDLKAAMSDHNEAVKLEPAEPTLYETRASFLKSRGFGDYGRADIAKAKELRAKKLETGLKITEIIDGGAATKTHLKTGDILVSVGGARVKVFEDLVAALAKAKGEVEIVYIDSKTRKREKLSIAPVEGKIGVRSVPVQLD